MKTGEVMKYAILIGDGMADYPIKELGGKTILQQPRRLLWIILQLMENGICKNNT